MIKMLILLCLVFSLNGESIEDFQPGEFWKWKQDTFYQVNHGASFSLEEGLMIVDLGDINSDKTTDLISVSADRRGFGVHYYLQGEMRYRSEFYKLNGCDVGSLAFLAMEF